MTCLLHHISAIELFVIAFFSRAGLLKETAKKVPTKKLVHIFFLKLLLFQFHFSSPSALIGGFSQPQPQPNQLSSNSVIQTGRVIQSVIEDNSQQLAVASTTVVSKVEEKKPFVSIFQKRLLDII